MSEETIEREIIDLQAAIRRSRMRVVHPDPSVEKMRQALEAWTGRIDFTGWLEPGQWVCFDGVLYVAPEDYAALMEAAQ